MASTNASTKILGFEYQKMVALIKCLEAKNNTVIHLECFGDVSDGDVSTVQIPVILTTQFQFKVTT